MTYCKPSIQITSRRTTGHCGHKTIRFNLWLPGKLVCCYDKREDFVRGTSLWHHDNEKQGAEAMEEYWYEWASMELWILQWTLPIIFWGEKQKETVKTCKAPVSIVTDSPTNLEMCILSLSWTELGVGVRGDMEREVRRGGRGEFGGMGLLEWRKSG